ncbi:hypothetical protein JD276_08830 [Leucobacter sp. CSA1]|uniref:Uncharacterized protein n=1 Tax=Leucobacter chromiisoli TaxID=2796471 RepID=A0A934Q9Q6_9MICO|nr:hypothetical protein [Leucobacter chromiisoli]MBK0419137.1 hypothetical protein [Leucobacter chromiisoli]
MNQIAEKYGIHRVTVSIVLGRNGTSKRPKGLNDHQKARAVELYESGLSLATVGKQLGFNATTIRAALLKQGVSMRDPHGRAR